MDQLDFEPVAASEQIEAPAEKKDPRDTPEYWREFIKSAKKAADPHWKMSKAGWDEFKRKRPSHAADENNQMSEAWAPYPLYWSSTKTVESAYYSRPPKVTTEREFGIDDDMSLTMSHILERLGKRLLRDSDFDAVMRHAVGQYIHCDKSSIQLMYEVKTETQPTGEIDDMGQPIMAPIPTKQKIYLGPLNYNEVLHTPNAKTENAIREKAFYFRLTVDEAKAKFTPEVCAKIDWKKFEEKQDNQKDDGVSSLEQPGEYVEGWECYSKPNETIYFVSEQYTEGFLKVVRDNPYGLKDFFPATPFQISSPNDTDMYPITAYGQCEDLLKQAHASAARFNKLYKSVRRRALVDGGSPELVAAFEELGDNEFIVVENLIALIEKGGVDALVHYLPVAELVSAIAELFQIKQQIKDEFYEWFGVPDILRGASDPVETAAAQEIKVSAAHDRFKYSKRQIAMMARDALEMMIDLALRVYDDEKIAHCTGFDYMTLEHQERFPEALARLRSDSERMVRIAIDTDTLSFLDMDLRRQQTEKAVGMVTTGLQAVSSMAEQGPDFVSVGLQVILTSLENVQTGKEFSDSVKKAVNGLIEKISQPPAETPPPPDYEQMKIDVASARAQTENFKVQADLNLQMREQDRKDYETRLKERDSAFEQQIQSVATGLDQRIQQFVEFIESQRLQIDQMKVQLDEREKFMEEQRLMADTQIEALRVERESPAKEMQSAQLQPPMIIQPPPMAPINLHMTIDASKKGATVTSINHDEFGNATMTTLPLPESPI